MIRRRKLLKTHELYLLMELVDGTSLDIHRPNTLVSLIEVFLQVAGGLAAMHRLGYVHADIKPNNILVNEKLHVKIIDFGQSCSIATVKTRIQGTPDYIAPEQVGRGPLTPATDVFNFGATMYWCVTDHHIPTLIPKKNKEADKNTTTISTPRELKPPHEINPRIPMPLSRLIVDCVQNRPSHRPPDFTTVITRLELALTVHKSDTLIHSRPSSDLAAAIPESKDTSADDTKDDEMLE